MNWQKVPISQLGRVVTGKTPPTKQRQYYDGDYPFITPSDLDYDTYKIRTTTTTLSEEAYAKFLNQFVTENTVTFTCIASVGKIGIATTASLTNQQINSIIVNNEHDHCFIYYLLRNEARRISAMCTGVATPIINKGDFEKIEVKVPGLLAIERNIASILSAYDDLIENNRRRIQLLEEAARLLYKEWFVHLRFPGHEHVKITDGVPEGWRRKKISEVCETFGGGTPSTKVSEYWDGDITWIVPSDVTKNNSLVLLDSERKITHRGLRESSAKLVPPDTILMTSRASVGYFALIDIEVCTNQGFINIVPYQSELRMYLLFNLLSRVTEIRSNAKGTTYPEISKGRFREMDILIPSNVLLLQFDKVAYDIIRQVRYLMRSNAHLVAARDLLLPRLMSGEVAV
ncbi:MAG TPA: restriction endonuclease subunit S [bacterium]|nr:restriction endonuclease subunit S [bacterium]HPQ72153.1 restriction endonuclease subunit S [bacterium]